MQICEKDINMNLDLLIRMVIINNKYKVIEKIGSGAFGSIYKGQNIRTDEYVAIKVEPISYGLRLLINESKIYQHLNGCAGIPNVKWFGKDEVNYYMVINLLGTSLQEQLYKAGKFSLPLILKIGIKIVTLLKTIHNKGLVHRDIKPDNFLFGRGHDNTISTTLYLIDFGFCRSYLDVNNNHIQMKTISSTIGSMNYCSVSSHLRTELSRRDDLESLGYMLLYFYAGSLPWSNDDLEQVIVSKKQSIVYLKNEWPDTLLQFIHYTKKMDFTDEPNYYYIIELFTKELEK